MALQARPWIKADLANDGDFVFQSGIGYFTPFHLNLTNIGHLPAFDVQIDPHERIPSAGVTPIMFHISSGMTY
jgi:hypothetical protein